MSEAPAIPRSRWLRYSLRSLLVVVTVLAIWLGIQADRAVKQRRAVEMIRSFGGEVSYDYQMRANGSINRSAVPWAPGWLRRLVGEEYFISVTKIFFPVNSSALADITDEDVALLADLKSLRALNLPGAPLTDRGAAHLASLSNLEGLAIDLSRSSLTDGGLASICKLTTLDELSLGYHSERIGPVLTTCPITDKDLRHLRQLTGLEVLYLDNLPVTGEVFQHLGDLTKLELLSLSDTQANDEALKAIASLPNLWWLELERTAVTDRGLKPLAKNSKLQHLILVGTDVTDDGIAHLQSLPNLAWLELDDTAVCGQGLEGFPSLGLLLLKGTRVSDANLKYVAQLPKLVHLDLRNTTITDAGVSQLRNPSLRVVRLEKTHVTEAGADRLRKATGATVFTDANPSSE